MKNLRQRLRRVWFAWKGPCIVYLPPGEYKLRGPILTFGYVEVHGDRASFTNALAVEKLLAMTDRKYVQ